MEQLTQLLEQLALKLACIQASEFLEKKLPKYWIVDISKDRQRGIDTVIQYINRMYCKKWYGYLDYYGYDGNTDEGGVLGSDIKPTYNNPTLLTIEEFLTYPEVRKVLELNEITKTNKQMKDTRFPFKLSIVDAKKIINIACETWKDKLRKLWAEDLLMDEYTSIEEDFYKEMRKACTEPQHKLFDKIFGKDEVKLTYEDVMKSFDKLYHTLTTGGINESNSIAWNDPNETYSERIHEIQQAQLKLANVAKYLNKDKIDNGYYFYLNAGNLLSKLATVKCSLVYFKTSELAKQALEILGEETIRLACQPLND